MNKNLYNSLRQNWDYVHPLTKVVILVDYYLETGIDNLKIAYRKFINRRNLKLLYWLPRISGIVFITFISMLALDVFTNNRSIISTLQAFLNQLIPSFALLFMLLVAWKSEIMGGSIFILTFLTIFGLIIIKKPLFTDLVFFVPLLIIGTLFIMDSFVRQMDRR